MTANVALTDTFDQWRVKTNEFLVGTQSDGMNNIIKVIDTTNSTSNSTGSIITTGGVGITKSVVIGENLNVHGNIHANGAISADGSLTLGDADTDSVDFNADIASHIIPNANLTYNIGNTTMYWANTWSGHLTTEQKTDSGKPAITVSALDLDQIAVDINAGQTTANVVDIVAANTTTGTGLYMSMASLTTGPALYIDSDSDSTATRSIASIIQNHVSAVGATALTLQADAGRGLFINTDLAAGGYALEIDSEQTTTNTAKVAAISTSGTTLEVSSVGVLTGKVIDITADAATTGTGINMSMDGLTTGSALAIDSNSADTGTRNIASIIQNHASASGSTTLYLQNDHATANALKVVGAVAVGVDGTGHDVKFFGDTASAFMEWDQSADELEIRGPVATPGKLLLSTAEATMVDGNKMGQIDFQAPLDGAGTDAILVGASIYAEADATFSSSVNATELVFATAASDTAAEQMRLTSTGQLGINTAVPASLLHVAGTVQVGVDNTGHDVQFFGATTGQYMKWAEAQDELILALDAKLSFWDAAGGENIIASADGHLEVNAGTTLDITAPTVDINAATLVQIDGAVSVGVDDTGYDVKFFGATAGKSLLWDESADELVVTGKISHKKGAAYHSSLTSVLALGY